LTAIGGWLRRYKLDELPQLINVILGDMSLVGPRPKVSGHESILMKYRPGITGAATLAFRREEELLQHVPIKELESFYSANIRPVKHNLDSEYMARATFSSDLTMLLQTVKACLTPRTQKIAIVKPKEHRPLLNEGTD
jgi:lipopolysaccharide/colanic/teichoic acid biosynthesis glycosyltransferase